MKTISKRFKTLLGGGLISLFSLVAMIHAEAQTCTPPPSGLVSWWPGDGNANDIKDGNNGTLQNGATFSDDTDGKVSQAFSLDGVDDYVQVPASASLNTLTAITIDVWIKPVAAPKPIVEYSTSTDFGPHLWIHTDNDPFVNFVDLNGGYHILKGGPANAMTLNQWHHLAATYEKTIGMGSLYLDGLEVISSNLGSFDLATNRDVYIGFRPLPAEPSQNKHFQGLIDEVEISNRALSAEEIAAIYNAGAAGKCKVTVQIDIKPGTFPNTINPSSKGKVPVAILTTGATDNTDTFDAATVDPTTVLFGATGTEAAPVQDALQDVDGDGDTDMIFKFNTQDTGIECGDTSATLTGKTDETFGGQTIHGTDSIQTVRCK